MPDVHVPELDEYDDEEPTAPVPAPVSKSHHRSKSFVTIALEVVLISAGVFLGLMGEQWRERTEHRELAAESLRRFRTEITTNRDALVSRNDYHANAQEGADNYTAQQEYAGLQRAIVAVHVLRPIVDAGFRRGISLDSELQGRCVLLRSRAAQGVRRGHPRDRSSTWRITSGGLR